MTRLTKALSVAIVLTVFLLLAMVVYQAGAVFGLWDRHTQTVTVICVREPSGKTTCASTPIKVKRDRDR